MPYIASIVSGKYDNSNVYHHLMKRNNSNYESFKMLANVNIVLTTNTPDNIQFCIMLLCEEYCYNSVYLVSVKFTISGPFTNYDFAFIPVFS